MKDNNLKILLVEDNGVNQFVLQEILERHGCSVYAAVSGEEALSMAAERSFDLVLLDLQLPGISGLEVARRLTVDSYGARLIALSGSTDAGTRRDATAAGICAFLAKPVHTLTLLRTIDALLATSLAGRSAGTGVEPHARSLRQTIMDTIASRGYSEENRRKMMEIAPRELRLHLDAIIEAYTAADYRAIARETHSLKGSFGALGLSDYHARTADMHFSMKILLDPGTYDIYLDCNGLLFKERDGAARLFLAGEYETIPEPEELKKELLRYFRSALTALNTRELSRFIDPEINRAGSTS